jgi:hypothetical protein
MSKPEFALTPEATAPDTRTADPGGLDGDAIGRAMHEASQVGGPWTPCTVPYGQWPECEHEPMGRHVAVIIAGRRLTPGGLRAFWNGDESRRVIVQLPPIGPDGRCTRCGSTPSRDTGSCRCHRVVIEQVGLRAALDDPERFGWKGPPEHAIAYAAAIRDVADYIERFCRSGALTPEATAPDARE